jgi:phospholipid/cholesterol/gamma-HCH transport system substrate-binding protein
VLWLASGGAFQQKYDLYLAIENESVAGLNVNAPVKYNGVDVGKVRHIHLDPENTEQVNLLFAIERGTPIKEDTVAVLKTQGLTGIAYVELSGGTRDSPPLRATVEGRYPVIRTKPSLSARLENILTSVLAKLDSTTSNINAMLSDENKAALKNALADIARRVAHDRCAQGHARRGHGQRSTHFRQQRPRDGTARPGDRAHGPGDRAHRPQRRSRRKMGNEAALASASAGKTVDAVGADVRRFTV